MVFIIKAEIGCDLLYAYVREVIKIRDCLLDLEAQNVLVYRHTEKSLEFVFCGFDGNVIHFRKLGVFEEFFGIFMDNRLDFRCNIKVGSMSVFF